MAQENWALGSFSVGNLIVVPPWQAERIDHFLYLTDLGFHGLGSHVIHLKFSKFLLLSWRLAMSQSMDPGLKKVVRTEAADRHPLMPYPRHELPCSCSVGCRRQRLACHWTATDPTGRWRHLLPAQKLCLSGWLGLLHPNVLTLVDFDGYCMGCAQVPGCRRQCSAGLSEQQHQTGMVRLLHMRASHRLQAWVVSREPERCKLGGQVAYCPHTYQLLL